MTGTSSRVSFSNRSAAAAGDMRISFGFSILALFFEVRRGFEVLGTVSMFYPLDEVRLSKSSLESAGS